MLNAPLTYYNRSLFAKSWRVYRLYFNQTLQLVKISDLQLLFILGGFVVVDIVSTLCLAQQYVHIYSLQFYVDNLICWYWHR